MVNRRGSALALLAAMLFAAGGPAAFGQETMSDRMNKLESLVKAQQEQIVALQQELGRQQSAEVEQMRVAEIKRVVQELFRDQQFRDQLPLNAGYDNGFFIRSGQDFLLRINGGMQARYVGYYDSHDRNRDHASPLYGVDIANDRSGAEFNRLRLVFSGFAYDPNFTYRIELRAADSADVYVHYAWMDYKFVDAAAARIGLMQLPFGRSEPTDDFGLMFVDRSLASELFSAGRSMGLMLHGGFFDRKLEYYATVTNGLHNDLDPVDNPDATNELDTNPAVTARAVWHAMYESNESLGKDFATESDIDYHEKPALDFGASFAWNPNRGDANNVLLPFAIPDEVRVGPGGYGMVSTDDTNITQFGADAAFKYLGLSIQGEYFLRMIENEGRFLSPWFLATGNNGNSHQQGGYVQAGYFIVPEKLELAARLGGVWDFENDNVWEYSAGVNYYIRGNNLKLQADFTRVYELPIADNVIEFMNQNDDMTLFRVQLQASF